MPPAAMTGHGAVVLPAARVALCEQQAVGGRQVQQAPAALQVLAAAALQVLDVLWSEPAGAGRVAVHLQ